MNRVVPFLLVASAIAYFVQVANPELLSAFMFVPHLALARPWSFVSYMFLHGSLVHFGFNMLGLWFFGSAVESVIGARRFAFLYFLSGVSGALCSMLLSMKVAVIGASAGVLGVMLAYARFWPEKPILEWGVARVRTPVLVLIAIIMAILGSFDGSASDTASLAHLGGLVGAWFYLRGRIRWNHCSNGLSE